MDQVSRIEILELIVPQLEENDNEEVSNLTWGCREGYKVCVLGWWGGEGRRGTKSVGEKFWG